MPPPSDTKHLPSTHPARKERPKSPNRVLAEAEAQWIFSEAELANTPSIQDGMSQADEKDTRAKGVNFIIQVGVMLKLPQLTLSTAAIFFQRFLMRASLKKERNGIPRLHHFQSAATALFVAAKVEESSRKMKELILAFCRVAQKNPNLIIDEQNKDWWKWKDCVLYNEDVLMETICFDFTVESPHRQLFEMLKYYGIEHNKRLRNAAWSFVTDSSNTQLCLLCSSRTIAIAALYAACRYSDVSLPDDSKGRSWWEAQHVRLKDLRKAIEFMCTNYDPTSNKINGVSVGGNAEGDGSIYVGLLTPGDGEADLGERTRLKEDQVQDNTSPAASQPPPGSERRLSNASAAGVKREREPEPDGPPTSSSLQANGNHANGVKSEEPESKRPRLENGVAKAGGEAKAVKDEAPGSRDVKHEEEAKRVETGNKQEVAAVKAEDPTVQDEKPKSSDREEGELEALSAGKMALEWGSDSSDYEEMHVVTKLESPKPTEELPRFGNGKLLEWIAARDRESKAKREATEKGGKGKRSKLSHSQRRAIHRRRLRMSSPNTLPLPTAMRRPN
ncbi:uncharacterized protein LTR77_005581 [Saxophila tyrrhenica]|uniref:RNA polymerase II holoenzyme cyclin-like subunit n=1 Tax=Saxophila tyrrhenica TaxID=1690608 RepID=A0AAV9P8W8_9PEZI|nr:hypothetical protein LTR77_005581 [Saxophila tyrrhenica]